MTDERKIAELYCRDCRQWVGVLFEKDKNGGTVKRCLSNLCGGKETCPVTRESNKLI